jgi:hypothetical protein
MISRTWFQTSIAHYGMLDQRVASREDDRFAIIFHSFTGYINRMRGYHSQKDKLKGYEKASPAATTMHHIPIRQHDTLQPHCGTHGQENSNQASTADGIHENLPLSLLVVVLTRCRPLRY